jgi:hypothetical protein
MKDRPAQQHNTDASLVWARRVLRCYPRAWRDRYASEMELVLQHSPVTLWTLIDLFLGALDARLHPDLLPGRITSMTYRIRTSEIMIFCAFIVYGIAWAAVRFVRDPLPTWESAVQVHPEISTALMAVDGASIIALLAILIGGVPILYVVLRNAFRERRWRLLGLLALPLVAIALLAGYAVLASGAWTQRAANATPAAPFTPLALALQLGLVILFFAAVAASTAAVAVAVNRSHFSDRLLHFALFPAAVVTFGIVAGLVATAILTALIFKEAPQLGSSFTMAVVFIFMIAAAALALNALQRGIRAARQSST